MQNLLKELQEVKSELKRLTSIVESLEQRYCTGYSQLEIIQELKAKKALAKGKERGETAVCPACEVEYIKQQSGQIFCQVQCKHDFNDKLETARRNS